MMEPSSRQGNVFSPLVSKSDWGGRSTRAEIDLDALTHNYRHLQRCAAGATVMPVVKANAYGHGILEIARTLEEAGASWLGVYTVGEGTQLRSAGIGARVLVFGPFTAPEAKAACDADLTMTVSSIDAARVLQQNSVGRTVQVHVKIDTGLNRAGAMPTDVLPLLETVKTFSALHFEGIYTHFAKADEPGDSTTRTQLRSFLDTVECLERAGHRFQLKHAANSAGTLNFPDTHLDLVRPGIALYGYDPSTGAKTGIDLRPVLSLVSVVTRVVKVASGTGVGYGHDHICSSPSTIALVPIGYGDGLSRAHGSGRSKVLVEGALAPIVGRVSMDQVTIDVTGIEGVRVGSDVTLIGSQGGQRRTADDLAGEVGTLSYEVLSSLMPRVPRLYKRRGRILDAS